MTDREKLIELLKGDSCPSPYLCDGSCKYAYLERCFEERTADHLLSHGVTVREPVADLKEFAEDVAYQFGYMFGYNGRLHIGTGGLSTLEWAFDILGWDDPHPYPEGECEWEGCHEYATGGTPTAEGYRRLCGKHFVEIWKRRMNDERTV